MADAVLRERFVVAGAAIALLFLVVLVIVGCFLLLARAVDRYRRTDAKQADALAEQVVDPMPRTAIRDTEPGIDLALRDECDRILSAPSPFDEAGIDRLLAAIRDEPTGEAHDA